MTQFMQVTGVRSLSNEKIYPTKMFGLALVLGFAAASATAWAAAPETVIRTAEVPAGSFMYQQPGDYQVGGLPTDPVRVQGEVPAGLQIMSRQVSQAEYMQCVADGQCMPLDKGFRNFMSADRPAVGVSWLDAQDYAEWLSDKTGQTWRLPSYEEWVRAAAEKYQEEGELESDPNNPAVRWLAEYKRETQRRVDRVKEAQAFGYFGTNSQGVDDMAGNVWEWTDTCFMSFREGEKVRENCGIRVLAGAHVAAMPDFIRDPKAGACSIGLPPTNLGFRLVREN